ncbi:SET domain-containing protein [Nioella nitratireducens]|uniref:SET domain-containing protein n=1 Tax=Nioella nitratireducens TaxID=1287720 RepID=UPI0008FD8DC7|nr:SET domain-containing protein-lysine N-methyltransferase [Nioella nitratireducens]
MMMVRCYLGPSSIEGLGVFAATAIRKGALVRVHDSRFDVTYERDELGRVPAHFREFLERYTHDHPRDADYLVLDCDEARFMNHANVPNVDLTNPERGVAARDIAAGEELTCDYARVTGGRVVLRPSRHRIGQVMATA